MTSRWGSQTRKVNVWNSVKDGDELTEVNTSCVSWIVDILVQPNFWKSLIRAGLCNVAEGCVRKNKGNRFLLDNAGELDPYDNWKHMPTHKFVYGTVIYNSSTDTAVSPVTHVALSHDTSFRAHRILSATEVFASPDHACGTGFLGV